MATSSKGENRDYFTLLNSPFSDFNNCRLVSLKKPKF